ncbi:MAG: single-stranded-DNA-specific exonuclease RecJ, partial [Calothrix sp. SM1_7_51]|nr:single-stranded-DNA-specific exonuclease RecJ [Calothrix sp. SM1_7_51]
MHWILKVSETPPDWFIQSVKQYTPNTSGTHVAQLLWQRGIRDNTQLAVFIDTKVYQAASPFEFAQEMHLAMERLQQAWSMGEKLQ